jgi:hypothetical protein
MVKLWAFFPRSWGKTTVRAPNVVATSEADSLPVHSTVGAFNESAIFFETSRSATGFGSPLPLAVAASGAFDGSATPPVVEPVEFFPEGEAVEPVELFPEGEAVFAASVVPPALDGETAALWKGRWTKLKVQPLPFNRFAVSLIFASTSAVVNCL